MQRKKNAKTFEKEISKKLDSKFIISKNWQRLPVQVGFRISNENLGLSEFGFSGTGSYVTMWQNCIRPCGKVQLKSLVLTMRSDFNTGGVCKVVGTHRVLHLGSIEIERVTREWASEVPCELWYDIL